MCWFTTPKDEGGLGLIDPLLQCKAFLGKFLIRGLWPGSSKGELFVEDLDFGKEINIYTNLGSWRTVLEGGDAR